MTRPSTYADARERMTRGLIVRALAKHNDNLTRAAGALGITRTYMYRLLIRYEIARKRPTN